jgi:hypothetical protein
MKQITSTYVYCRALIAVVSTAGKDSLDDNFAVTLQDLMFVEYMRAEDSYARIISAVGCPSLTELSEICGTVT